MIHAMALVRNEEHRWLMPFINQMQLLSDIFTVADGNSTDNTARILDHSPYNLLRLDQNYWETDELYARKLLWEQVIKYVNDGDWIICLDADELLEKDHIPYLKYLFNVLPKEIDGIGFRLFDMWSDTHYREDQYWQAHRYMWPMAIRYKKNYDYKWNDKKLHCGRFPLNSSQKCYPTMIPIKHMGWSKEEYRKQKYERYMKIDGAGRNGILAQYMSIMDEKPNLKLFGSLL